MANRRDDPIYYEPRSRSYRAVRDFDDDRNLRIYADGSCFNNGYKGARAGYGVCFDDDNLSGYNVSNRLRGKAQTNQRAELKAVKSALDTLENHGSDILEGRNAYVVTDSSYVVKSLGGWNKTHRENGFVTSKGTEVKHKELIQSIDSSMQRLTREHNAGVKLCFLPKYAGHHGARMADRLAKEGANMNDTPPSRNW